LAVFLVQHVGADIGESGAAVRILQKRAILVIAAADQAEHFFSALVELVVAEGPDEVAVGVLPVGEDV
jgi:hypothetical protein